MTEPATARVRDPGPLGRFAYRFAAAYLLLYNAAALIGLLPWVGRYGYFVDRLWNHVVLWTEKSVLGMTTLSSLKISGSGDTSFPLGHREAEGVDCGVPAEAADQLVGFDG
jgi:hypothetical protein